MNNDLSDQKGQASFEAYYRQWFGEESRLILESLKQDYPQILRFDRENFSLIETEWRKNNLEFNPLSWYPNAILWPKEIEKPKDFPLFNKGIVYPMSPASLLPVINLKIETKDIVLDACASPGGKALAIVDYLNEDKQLWANELSFERMNKMKKVFNQYHHSFIQMRVGPAETIRKTTKWKFDKILVDAPCSSEYHVINSAKHLNQWSAKRVQRLHTKQVGLVESLIPLLNPGGRLVYSTCAITPEENELVANEVLLNNSCIKLIPWDNPLGSEAWGENLPSLVYDHKDVGRIMPHLHQMKPMFVAVLEKN